MVDAKRDEASLASTEYDRTAVARRFEADLPDLLQAIPCYRGQSYFTPSELTMGIIADEADCNYFQRAIHLVRIGTEDWEDLISEVDLMLYVTCREGEFGGVEGRVRATEILQAFRDAGVPTVFWSTLDPAGFEEFLPLAAEADIVLTVDKDEVEEYRRNLGRESVSYLGWGINPALNNPIGFLRRLDASTGSYARDAFFEGPWIENGSLAAEARRIFDGVLKAEGGRRLLIAPEGSAAFPEDYRTCILEPLTSERARKVQKLFHFAICLNSAQTGRLACSRRVYEAQAEGNVVLTNYSSAISNDFPGLFIVTDEAEVGRIMAGYTTDELVAMGIEGVRRMYAGNTVFDRLGELLSYVGLDGPFLERPVYVVVDEIDGEAEAFLAAQRCPGARLVEACDAGELADGFAIKLHAPYPAKSTFLIDLINVYKFSDAVWTAYAPSYAGAYEYAAGPAPAGPVMVDLSRCSAAALLSDEMPEDAEGFLVVEPRWGRVTAAMPKELAIIQPVYDNGGFLWGRSFRSLLRSSIFNRMQVYLVDDGSKDGETEDTIRRIASAYDNVTVYFFGDGGSGSASRSRNKGLELSCEPFVAFLDPDDEAVGDGYARLLDDVKSGEVDFAYGLWPTVKKGGKISFDKFGRKGDRRIDDPTAELLDSKFSFLDPQSCVIKRSFIKNANLIFVEGGVAEDTLFGFELMLNASLVQCCEEPVRTYWMDREDSVTNKVDAGYFGKLVLTHQRQVQVLREHGLLNEYVELRFTGYLNEWLLPQLGKVTIGELPESVSYLCDLVQLYYGTERLKTCRLKDAIEPFVVHSYRSNNADRQEEENRNLRFQIKEIGELNKRLSNRLTARVDVKDAGAPGNDVEVLEVSDPRARVEAPAWFCDEEGTGHVLVSTAGSLDVGLRCIGAGELELALRGQYVRDAEGNFVPAWIDYTSFAVDGRELLGGTHAVWHNKPFKHRMPVADGQVVEVSLTWHSHDETGLEAEQARVDALNSQIKALKGENASLQKAEKKQEKELATAEDEVLALRSSNSWKVGRFITWLPRKIKALFK